MVKQSLRDYFDKNYEEMVFFDNPSFDDSIIGLSSDLSRLIYSYDKMVEELASDEGWSLEDASDFIDYNTLRAIPYIPNAPIVLVSENVLEEFE